MTTRTKDEVIISSSGINVSDMSDVELMETLLKHGADVGPVTGEVQILKNSNVMFYCRLFSEIGFHNSVIYN